MEKSADGKGDGIGKEREKYKKKKYKKKKEKGKGKKIVNPYYPFLKLFHIKLRKKPWGGGSRQLPIPLAVK